MAKFWTDKDANGKPLTDGRVCLVITNDDDPDLPELRTYGRDKDEVLEKLARTTETAQATISRLRKTPAPAATPAVTGAAPRSAAVSTDEQARATADLSNPAKAPEAIKTLLRAAGVDVDEEQRIRASRRMAQIAEEWERRNPDFPADPRNKRMLVDRFLLRFGTITNESLDQSHMELMREELYHEPAPKGSTVPPDGSRDSRTVVGREATTYRTNSLRSNEPAPGSGETAKHKRWREILEDGNTKVLRDAIENESGFQEWANSYQSTPKRKTA